MPDYREIYNDIVANDERYRLAENSPGLRSVIRASDQLSMISGRSLDVGCGVGFVVQHLSGPTFDLLPFGADISDVAIGHATARLANFPGAKQRLKVLDSQQLPYEDDFFSLVTCFDVLEHLDSADIAATWAEISRVLRPGGLFLGSVSCRAAGINDKFGDNLHRTVQSVDWWLGQIDCDRAEYEVPLQQLNLWKHALLIQPEHRPKEQLATNELANASLVPGNSIGGIGSIGNESFDGARAQVAVGSIGESLSEAGEAPLAHGLDSVEVYQQIYDENPWYGDAEQGRCPGVRLLPQYIDWLIGPVMDLGCGRGQTVAKIRERGIEAEGVDQIRSNPEMRVGDITKPIEDLDRFKSVVCVDCIEHLYDVQVDGLFENMKKVQRQAFSIHNGPSSDTGKELHVNRMSFIDWSKKIREHFDIAAAIQIHPEQMLYLTQSRSDAI